MNKMHANFVRESLIVDPTKASSVVQSDNFPRTPTPTNAIGGIPEKFRGPVNQSPRAGARRQPENTHENRLVDCGGGPTSPERSRRRPPRTAPATCASQRGP